ncbi:MAG: hypothetical protein ACOCVJ_03575 [Verrucomicrobiota bacterium]
MKIENDPDEFLIACMSYCLLWELAGSRISETWDRVRDWSRNEASLSERQRWMVELYEERPPTVQEERSLLARIQASAAQRGATGFREGVLELIPSGYRDAAARHSLMAGLTVEQVRGIRRFWRKSTPRPVSVLKRVGGEVSLADREINFIRFLELPYFLDGFRRFWRQPPKFRSNVQTRVLLTLAAALSQMVPVEESEFLGEWIEPLKTYGYYTQATYQDLGELVAEMRLHTYDAQELAYHLLIDAKDADRAGLVRYLETHREHFSAFADTFLRRLQIG